jgi:hypothetical protein
MAQGSSGRVVIDLEPEFKQLLHETLKSKGISLKHWFIEQAETLCEEHQQPPLAFAADKHVHYRTTASKNANIR